MATEDWDKPVTKPRPGPAPMEEQQMSVQQRDRLVQLIQTAADQGAFDEEP